MGSQITTPPVKNKIKIGTYTGDGNATQAIIGVGFQPDFVQVIPNENGVNPTSRPMIKTNSMGLNTYLSFALDYLTDIIISFDTDGFTVGDGTGSSNYANALGRIYSYIALKGF